MRRLRNTTTNLEKKPAKIHSHIGLSVSWWLGFLQHASVKHLLCMSYVLSFHNPVSCRSDDRFSVQYAYVPMCRVGEHVQP